MPSGWMFNVSGLDALELVLANGKRFRIGTDNPNDVIEARRGGLFCAAPPAKRNRRTAGKQPG